MGWKTVKEQYRITHVVCVENGLISIGSGYVHNLIAINAEGVIVKRYDDPWASNPDLLRYMREMEADPAALRAAVFAKDSFSISIPVYTFEDDQIIEKACEETGWPHVTHDGDLMYENTYSTDRAQVVQWAAENLQAHIRLTQKFIEREEANLAAQRVDLDASRAALQRLLAAEPSAAAA